MSRSDDLASGLVTKLGHPINTSAVIIMGAYTLLWGLWVANPFWNAFERAPLYSALQSVAPEVVWGIVAMIVGFVMCYGVAVSSYRSLTTGAFSGFIHWLIIMGGYFAGDWQSTGGITSMMITIYCAFVYLNLRVNRDNLPFRKDQVSI